MNREIKFRFWDNYTGFKFIIEPNDFKYWQSGYVDNPNSKWPENMNQFTGLHDKNGKEIYEGDILCPTCNLDNKPDLTIQIVVTIPDIYFDFIENEYYIIGNIYETNQQ